MTGSSPVSDLGAERPGWRSALYLHDRHARGMRNEGAEAGARWAGHYRDMRLWQPVRGTEN
jgi:hypothetical protein